MRPEAPQAEDTEVTECVIQQGRALVHATEGLRVIERSGWFEPAIAGLLLAAYRRRLKMIIAAEGVGEPLLFSENCWAPLAPS